MSPNNRVAPATDTGLTPFLFCNEITVVADGAPLACPQCTGPHLHLDTIHFATPTNEHYNPAVGLASIPTPVPLEVAGPGPDPAGAEPGSAGRQGPVCRVPPGLLTSQKGDTKVTSKPRPILS